MKSDERTKKRHKNEGKMEKWEEEENEKERIK